MFKLYKVMLPLVLLVFILMGIWVSILHFTSDWVMYSVMGVEVMMAVIVMAIEDQAQHIGGLSHWGNGFGFVGLSISFAALLGIFRALLWAYSRI